MNFDANILVLIAGSFGTFLGAIISWLTAKSSMKVQEKQVDIEATRAKREEKFSGVEAADRLVQQALLLTQQMQNQYQDSLTRSSTTVTENDRLRAENIRMRFALTKASFDVKDMIEEHANQMERHQIDCAEFPKLQAALEKIGNEVDGILAQ